MTPTGLLAGLGNPGDEYRETRHNFGFLLLDRILELGRERKSMRLTPVQESGDAEVFSATLAGGTWLLVKPLTYMNRSGLVVGRYARRFGLPPGQVLVVHDEMDLPLGRIKFKRGGSSAGHNGVESVMAELGSPDFWRLRLGIGRPTDRGGVTDFVLEAFTAEERAVAGEVLDAAWKGLGLYFRRGEAQAVQFLHAFNAQRTAGGDGMDSAAES